MFGNKKRKQFERLFQPHLDAAYNLARYLSGNANDAEDIVQEAYLKAYRAFDAYTDNNARAWVLTITRNTCYSWLQKNRQNLYQNVPFDEQVNSAVSSAVADSHQIILSPLQQAEDEQLKYQIMQAIEVLPIEYRESIILREMYELSYKEIARITGVPQGTVMSRLARARKRLAKLLAAKQGEQAHNGENQ